MRKPAFMYEEAQDWIRTLDLAAHPEGGYYRETYRSDIRISNIPISDIPITVGSADHHEKAAAGSRSLSTAIYFLLEREQISSLHRIRSDEAWHFYAGSGLLVEGILTSGERKTWRLGLDADAGERPQCVVPAGTWFGAHLVDKTKYALAGCTVAPGFDFADFELARRGDLLSQFPQHADLIRRLTDP